MLQEKLFALSFMVCCTAAQSQNLLDNSTLKYVGFDWLNYPATSDPTTFGSAQAAFENISGSGAEKFTTNLNVVASINEISSWSNSLCNNRACVISVSAGEFVKAGSGKLDICPESSSHDECLNKRPYHKIWDIAYQISQVPASRRPTGIYFIDEPEGVKALRANNGYNPWSYPNYLCTLRQAMSAYGISEMKIFTALTYNSVVNEAQIFKETTEQMRFGNCINTRTVPDWIGVNSYYHMSAERIKATYAKFDAKRSSIYTPIGSLIDWVLIPYFPNSTPAKDEYAGVADIDSEAHKRMQPYLEFLFRNPGNSVAYVMFHRYDPVEFNKNPKTKAYARAFSHLLTSNK